MPSLPPDYLAGLLHDGRQVATVRCPGEYRRERTLSCARAPELLIGVMKHEGLIAPTGRGRVTKWSKLSATSPAND